MNGAANTSGHINGVAPRIQRAEPSAIFLHCLVQYNLCLQEVGKQILCVREALDLVMELFVINQSDLISLFESLMTQVSPGTPFLRPLV